MNAGIVTLQDGTPCIVYDEKLPHAIDHVSFNEDGYQLTLVYSPTAQGGHAFAFPLDPLFVTLLRERGNIAVAFLQNKQLVDINIYPVVFATD